MVKKGLQLLQKFYQLYVYTRNAPETIGPGLLHKLAIICMYCITCVCALYMVITVVTHQPVFRNVKVRMEKTTFESPSALLCPAKSDIYDYSFMHETEWISRLGLSVDAVNILAKAAKQGSLETANTANLLAPHIQGLTSVSKMTPTKMWRSIISWMYYNASQYYKIGVQADAEYMTNVDVECYGTSIRGHHLDCMHIEGIWLTDNSYCFLWNNTGRQFVFDPVDVYAIRIHPRFKSNHSYRSWVGNLLTDEIVLDELKINMYTISLYKMVGELPDVICQPLIEDCNSGRTRKSTNIGGYWLFSVSKQFKEVKNRENSELYFWNFLGNSWFEMRKITRYSPWKLVEVVGSIFGAWAGVSILALVKIGLVLIKKASKLDDKVVLFIEAMIILALFVCSAVLQVWNVIFLENNRYINQFNIRHSEGAPYPDFQFCFRFLTAFNVTEVEKHKISYPLLVYITSTAILTRPINYMTPSDKPYFLYDKHTPVEVGYHWSFMQFPLQYQSEELYEEHMTKVENEYEALANKLGVDPSKNSSSWEVFKKLLLDPCKAIKYCYINGRLDKSCCVHFQRTTAGKQYNFQGCWSFDNNNQLRQTRPGKQYGLRVIVDTDEMHHTMPHVWLDDYLHGYVKNCSASHNSTTTELCSTKYSLGWNPYSAVILTMHRTRNGELFQYIIGPEKGSADIMLKGEKAEVSIQMTENIRLPYKKEVNETECLPYPHQPVISPRMYLKQEIMYKHCGCYICHYPPLYHTQTKPCCTTKKAGRCLTDRVMYDSRCYKNGTEKHKRYKGMNPLQIWNYAGNIPAEAPVNVMIQQNLPRCDLDVVYSKPSKFHELYETLKQKFPELKKPLCRNVAIKTRVTVVKNENVQEKDFFEYNLYYPLAQYFESMELDLQNFWENLGLVCGTFALFFGLTYMALLEGLVTVVKKIIGFLTGNSSGGSGLASKLTKYSLYKFTERLKYIPKQDDDADTAAEPPTTTRNVVKVEPLNENYEMEGINEGDRVGCSNTAFVEGYLEDSKIEVDTIPAKPEKKVGAPDKSANAQVGTLLTESFYCTGLLSGIALMILICAWLQVSMHNDRVTVQFDLLPSGIFPPTVGMCITRRGSSLQVSEKKILGSLKKCQFQKNVVVDCKKMFTVFAGSHLHDHDCAFSTYDGFHIDSKPGRNDLSIEIEKGHETFSIWAGDMKTISDGIIPAETLIPPNSHLSLKYQQWEVKESTIECAHNLEIKCSTCEELGTEAKLGFCCASDQFVQYNLTAPPMTHCMSSFYELNTALNEYDSTQNTSYLTVTSEVNVKRVITREPRRTLSEEAMLYAGYVDIFIGINMDNVIYVVSYLFKMLFC